MVNSLFGCLFTLAIMASGEVFHAQQMEYERVIDARVEKEIVLKTAFQQKGLSYPPSEIFIRAFKLDKDLEIWVKQNDEYILFETYDICKSSGLPGPKFKQGDLQVPEGFYYIDRFNPVSKFHLSLGINYPNAADLARTDAVDPGGDIFIHGNCCTIGCLPMTDDKIKEIYLLAIEARSSGQGRIPVHIFPARMNGELMTTLLNGRRSNDDLIVFWRNLKVGFDYFEDNGQLPIVETGENGEYSYN